MSVWEGREHKWSAGAGAAPCGSPARRRDSCGAAASRSTRSIVGYPGHARPTGGAARGPRAAGRLQPARLARRHARRRPRRASGRSRSPRGRSPQSTGTRSARPTSSSPTRAAHAEHLAGLTGARRVEVCFVGAEERVFQPGWARPDGFTVLFVGKLIPLHGLETILAAARIAPELRFRVVGSGQLDSLLAGRPPNVEHVPWVDYERLPERAPPRLVRARDLRHVGESGAGDPEQGLPGARLRDAARHRRHAGGARAARGRRERPARPAGRPGRLAAALRRLAADPGLAESLSTGGLAAYRASASEQVLGARWRGLIEGLAVRARPLLWTAIVAYAAGFGSLSILRHRAFDTGRYDLGNMVQTVWNTAHGHFLQMTSGDGRQISRLAAHFDPILAAFAPLWWIWPSPEMLLAVQAIAVALGALPVFWLARKHVGSERAGLAFALVYLLFPATQWLTLNEFHPVALACPLLLYAFWYLDEDRLVPFAVFAVLAMTTKEEIGLVVAGFGLWYAIRRRNWRTGGLVVAVGVLVSALAIGVIIPHYNDGADSSFYGRYDASRRVGRRDREDAFHAPVAAVRAGLPERGRPLPDAAAPPARAAAVRRAARPRRRVAGARAEHAVGDTDAVVDPLPLRRRRDPAAHRRRRPRRRCDREALPGEDGADRRASPSRSRSSRTTASGPCRSGARSRAGRTSRRPTGA